MNKNNFFTAGITDLLILSILKPQDGYMYDIINAITDYSKGKIVISQNTIYTAAYRLEKEGSVSSYSKPVGKRRTRVYYHIEPKGEKYLEKLLETYKNTTEGVFKILSLVEGA